MIRLGLHGAVVLGLTLLTQIGGLAYLLATVATAIAARVRRLPRWTHPVTFLGLYVGLSLLAAALAPSFGRTPLPCFASENAKLAMQSPMYCALNRHYVAPALEAALLELSSHMDRAFPGTVTLALDGSFPFMDGFPLLPHLSHGRGRAVDLAFYYRAPDGGYVPGKTRSPLGYWAFEEPRRGSHLPCAGRNDILTLRWGMRWFAPFLGDLRLEPERTRAALEWLTSSGRDLGVSKVFLEPHLAAALGLASDVVRFQGCRAARHDDHIHVVLGP